MALFYLFVTLLAQGALISCQEEIQLGDVLVAPEAEPIAAIVVDETAKPDEVSNPGEVSNPDQAVSPVPSADLFDILLGTEGNFVPVSSAAAMEQITSPENSPSQKVEAVKDMTQKIMGAVKKEMEELLNYAMASANNVTGNETERKKRSTDSSMDSASLLMRLLAHMKDNNEHQNIALDNMVTAQEIANKYGIKYNPDIDLLSNLVAAASEKVKEIANIVKDADEHKSQATDVEFVPLDGTSKINDDTYYVYSVEPEVDHIHIDHVPHHHHHHQTPPVSYRRKIFESNNFTPKSAPCEIVPPAVEEPELNGEEHEETISSKVFIENGEEPGSASVNRVMTHTISQKGYFKTPRIESLPQQVQYSFYLE